MNEQMLSYFGQTPGMDMMSNYVPYFAIIFPLLVLWSLIWKGIALWKCGRNNQPVWFVVLLVVNTLGILEILYLAFWQKKKIEV